ncbi:WD40 repeat domain-containing protein [Streptomyces sp. NPDC049954]|uniref:WD40 repeat domain-containing protein n=1 Tax=Streptomyces sp. NPDC049954 TaxID=3155779 RepID=UPI00342C9C93
MNVDQLLRASLKEQADEVEPASADLADRVLAGRARRRTRRLASTAVAVAALTAAAVTVPRALDSGSDAQSPAARSVTAHDVTGHPDQSPPRELIAAGDTAVAAWFTTDWEEQPNGDRDQVRSYHLYDAGTGRYTPAADWSYVSVAPGLRTAAVLERDLPARRIGLVDLRTGEVTRWIAVDRPVGSAEFSPDGKKLLVTTYDRNPDHYSQDTPLGVDGKDEPGPDASRTGFGLVDVASGAASWHTKKEKADPLYQAFALGRSDFVWSHDGKWVFGQLADMKTHFFDLDGASVPRPASEQGTEVYTAGPAPDGKRAGGDFAGRGKEISSWIVDPGTGRKLGTVPAQQLLTWADNDRLIGWSCDPAACRGKNEFRNRLVLVETGKKTVTPLSGFRPASADGPRRWTPVFAGRR